MSGEYEPPTREILEWVGQRVHARGRVAAVARLRGGITADMDRVTVVSPVAIQDVVLRRWASEDWTRGLVRREASGLAAISGHGVPAPELLAMDEDGAETGVRCTLTSALPGQPDLAPADPQSWLGQLAVTQAAVHAVPEHLETRWDGAPSWDRHGGRHRPLGWLSDCGLRAAAREAASGPLGEEEVLVHGDCQPFNVLWCDGRLTGVVDWPKAATGNRGSDAGHCRLNLAVLFDAETASDYLVRYERAAGARVDRRGPRCPGRDRLAQRTVVSHRHDRAESGIWVESWGGPLMHRYAVTPAPQEPRRSPPGSTRSALPRSSTSDDGIGRMGMNVATAHFDPTRVS